MTRVNTLHVHLLTNNQLLAEYREIPRIINKVSKGKLYSKIPDSYRMNTGHESFFGDKLAYIHFRHQDILNELAYRKSLSPEIFKSDYIIDTSIAYRQCQVLFKELCNDYKPSIEDVCINLDRLVERQYLQTKSDKFGNKPINKNSVYQDWLINVVKCYNSQEINNQITISSNKWKRVAINEGLL